MDVGRWTLDASWTLPILFFFFLVVAGALQNVPASTEYVKIASLQVHLRTRGAPLLQSLRLPGESFLHWSWRRTLDGNG